MLQLTGRLLLRSVNLLKIHFCHLKSLWPANIFCANQITSLIEGKLDFNARFMQIKLFATEVLFLKTVPFPLLLLHVTLLAKPKS